MDGLLDDWMIGFEFKATQERSMGMRIMEKAFRIIYPECFCFCVLDTNHPPTQRAAP